MMQKVKLNKKDVQTIENIKKNPSLSEQLKSKFISDIMSNRCSKCNTALVEIEAGENDFDNLSEGQMADYEAGFNRDFYCPKCKTTSSRDVEVFDVNNEEIIPTPTQLEALEKGRRTSWSNKDIRGYIGEMWFANKLRNEGFKVRKTMSYDYEQGISVFNETGVKNLLQEYPKKEKLMKLLITFGKGYPDLICLKDNKISFYEVKTNSSELKEHQKQVIDVLQSEGYKVQLVRLNVDFKAEETK
ncbi:MAG: VRR-NUC domain-containing protein [Candidatus Pacearchaeota archaeon]|nr:VRR-NUC domain-containing protein [Candidatus Pacearchaeota archaeon]